MCSNQSHYIIWKLCKVPNVDNFLAIKIKSFGTCKYRIAFVALCAHDMSIDASFDVAKYFSRWLCSTSFTRLYEKLVPTTQFPYNLDDDNTDFESNYNDITDIANNRLNN